MFKVFKAGDFLILAIFSVILVISLSIYLNLPSGDILKIDYQNQTIKYSLNQNKKIDLENLSIEINMGKARIRHSNCKNQYCVMQGWISHVNQSIICVPNLFKMTISQNMDAHDSTNY
ncbi:NusG domain II-containing protein [Methylophilaceae bacterium]|nr:NusG domain II-containing protein [Methylophilaceae bacterium]